MFKKSFKSRRKLPIINGLLAIMMMLGTFSAAYAQGGNTQVLLPLVHASSNVAQPVDGPFLDLPELSALDEIEINETEIESVPELSAAGSCYNNSFERDTFKWGGYYRTAYIKVKYHRGSFCNDLNINTGSLFPLKKGKCIKYWINIYDSDGNLKRNSGSQTICNSGGWRVLTYGLANNDAYRIYFLGGDPGWVELAD